MGFADRVGFGIFIMTVTTAQVGFVIIHTVNTFKMLSCLTCGTNHLTMDKQ